MVPVIGGLCTPQGAAHCPQPWSGPQKGEDTILQGQFPETHKAQWGADP